MIRTDNKEAVRVFLKKEAIANLNILNLLEELDLSEREIYVDQIKDMSIVLVHTGYMNYLYAEDLGSLDKIQPLLNTFPEGFGFSGVKKEIYEALIKQYEEDWSNKCYLYIMPSNLKVPVFSRDYFDELGPDDVATVDSYYTFRDDSSYIQLRKDILKRPSICVRIEGELRSWLLVHEDGSMGVMYTKEAYRKHGYGHELTMEMIRMLREQDKKPYVQIDIENLPSIKLAEKCGFRRVGEVTWFGVKTHSSR
jgi:GNAT superfamily N-acetyltransferase